MLTWSFKAFHRKVRTVGAVRIARFKPETSLCIVDSLGFLAWTRQTPELFSASQRERQSFRLRVVWCNKGTITPTAAVKNNRCLQRVASTRRHQKAPGPSPTGNEPLLTHVLVFSYQVQPGDTLRLMKGEYWETVVTKIAGCVSFLLRKLGVY